MKILKFFTPLLLLLLFSTIFTSVALSPLLAKERQEIFVIAEQGSELMPTTVTEAKLTIQIQAETLEQVQTAIASQSDSLLDYLRNQGVDKLQIQELQIEINQNNEGYIDSYSGNKIINFIYVGDHSQVKQILENAIEETKASRGKDWLASSCFYEIITSEEIP